MPAQEIRLLPPIQHETPPYPLDRKDSPSAPCILLSGKIDADSMHDLLSLEVDYHPLERVCTFVPEISSERYRKTR